jgi:hypothetical protein
VLQTLVFAFSALAPTSISSMEHVSNLLTVEMELSLPQRKNVMTATQIIMTDVAAYALLSSTINAQPKHQFKGLPILYTAHTHIPSTSQLSPFKRLTTSTPSG